MSGTATYRSIKAGGLEGPQPCDFCGHKSKSLDYIGITLSDRTLTATLLRKAGIPEYATKREIVLCPACYDTTRAVVDRKQAV